MKKLVYIWVNNYKNTIIQQGYQLSPEILVEIEVLSEEESDDIKLSVNIEDNRSNVFENFYGKNISSVMAFVGKNGSGKTTVSRMLLEYLPDALMSNDSLNNAEFLESLGISSDWDNRVLYVFYDEEESVVSVCPNAVRVEVEWNIPGLRCKKIGQNNIYQELSSAVRAGIYLTNVFNPSELLESYHKLDLGDGVIKFQQTYSPAFLLKHESEEQTKNLYGYRTPDNRYIGIIQRYAQTQMNSLSIAFMNKQAALFLESYYGVPDRLKDDLHIYQEFDLEAAEFGTQDEVFAYIAQDGSYNDSYQRLDQMDQILIDLKRKYISRKDAMKNDLLTMLYLNMLLEVYGVLCGPGGSTEQYIAGVLESDVTDIDRKALNLIKDSLSESQMRDSDWANQILEFIDFLLDQKEPDELRSWMGKTGNRSFDEKEFLEWYYKELIKETSFVKRNLIFRWKPVSSGEMAVANLFSYLDDAIRKLKIKGNRQNILIIFDELDCYLHPKWQQYIVKVLLERLQDYQDYMFQVIITSHSPIILSDICRNNILKLDKFKAQLETNRTFGADISHLYYDSFFMKEGDIGEFAKQNIQYAVNALKEQPLTEEEKILFILDNIGMDIVRKKLLRKYERVKLQEQLKEIDDTLTEEVFALDIEERIKVLDFIKQMKNP